MVFNIFNLCRTHDIVHSALGFTRVKCFEGVSVLMNICSIATGMMTEVGPNWQRHFFYRKQAIKTTWTFRLVVLILVFLVVSLTRGFWIPGIGQSLVCAEDVTPSDVIVVENFDPNYLLFERAAALQRAGVAAKLLIPTEASRDPEVANPVSEGIADLMAQVARMQNFQIIPIREMEPVSLNAAYQVRNFLKTEHFRSIIVVSPGFRSRRSYLIYSSVMGPAGIRVSCIPVFGQKTPRNWTETWHGIQEVSEEFLKLQYYRFFVLPLSLIH